MSDVDLEKTSSEGLPESEGPSSEDVRLLVQSVYDLNATVLGVLAPKLELVSNGLETVQKEKVGREESKERARRSVVLVLSAVVIALILNTLLVVGVIVPKCYSGPGTHGGACTLIPGFSSQQKRNAELLNQFQQSQQDLATEIQTARNRQIVNGPRLDQLEREVRDLRARAGLPPDPVLPKPPN